jgi:hypothetical protein
LIKHSYSFMWCVSPGRVVRALAPDIAAMSADRPLRENSSTNYRITSLTVGNIHSSHILIRPTLGGIYTPDCPMSSVMRHT